MKKVFLDVAEFLGVLAVYCLAKFYGATTPEGFIIMILFMISLMLSKTNNLIKKYALQKETAEVEA